MPRTLFSTLFAYKACWMNEGSETRRDAPKWTGGGKVLKEEQNWGGGPKKGILEEQCELFK